MGGKPPIAATIRAGQPGLWLLRAEKSMDGKPSIAQFEGNAAYICPLP